MNNFIQSNGGVVSTVILVAMVLNFVMSGLSKALETIKDKTETKTDDKIWAVVNKIAQVLQKIIDWGSANRAH